MAADVPTPEEARALRVDRRYAEFAKREPGVSFAAWLWRAEAEKVRAGRPHPTIGGRLAGGQEWERAGEATFRLYRRLLDLPTDARVVDYGCGTLRVGLQLIRYLDRGGYRGLEPTADFVAMARDLAGPLLDEKDARVDVLDEAAIESAVRFGADVTLSTAVAFHIHPDDAGAYLSSLARLAHRPGARVLFDAKVADRPLRYDASGWAWPLEHFAEHLAPLELVRYHHPRPYRDLGCTAGHLEFRRPG